MAMPGVFDMLKVGIGPSSSHTLGPWRAAAGFLADIRAGDESPAAQGSSFVVSVTVDLYGSLALTGRGHGTDIALMMGLAGADPVTVPVEEVHRVPAEIARTHRLRLGGIREIDFNPETHIRYHPAERLPYHANGMIFTALDGDGQTVTTATVYSVGGGFVVRDGDAQDAGGQSERTLPWPVTSGADLINHCRRGSRSIAEIVRDNERVHRSEAAIDDGLDEIWRVMREAVYRGCTTRGTLPGGLEVSRRAPDMVARILAQPAEDITEWLNVVSTTAQDFSRVLKLVGAFAIAVNEENAALRRIVTAPTNGSAGVIPAVLMYYTYFSGRADDRAVSATEIGNFLLVAGAVGSIFKHGATISAAMGGCQAEIGVSSAMAAAALAEGLGGSPAQALMAAEIAMEHHLGLTCDPIAGLVQVPCIERNSMGAIKAITAAHIAVESDVERAKVTLDDVVKTMWDTAQDMNSRYKETSLGGLAVNVSVRVPEC